MTISVLNLGWDSAALNQAPIAATPISAFLEVVESIDFDRSIIYSVDGVFKNARPTSIIQLTHQLSGDLIEIIPTSSLRRSKRENSLIEEDLSTYKYLVFRKLIKGESFVSRTRSPMFYVDNFLDSCEVYPCGKAAESESYTDFLDSYQEAVATASNYLTGNDLKVAIIDKVINLFQFQSNGKGNKSKVINGDISESTEYQEIKEYVFAARKLMKRATLRVIPVWDEFTVRQEESGFLLEVENLIKKLKASKNVVDSESKVDEINSLLNSIELLNSTIAEIENTKLESVKVLFDEAKAHIAHLEEKKATKKPSKTSKTRIIADQAEMIAALEAQLAALTAAAAAK